MFLLSSEVVWQQLERQYGETGGVYKLRCLDNGKGAKFLPINRILGIDQEGVLYIGKARVLRTRIADLMKSLSPNYKSCNHPAGLRYKINQKLQEAFPFERLCVTVIQDDDPDRKEIEEMREYFDEFGEVPPFNASDLNDPHNKVIQPR